jgi:tetratricopeptide (TPR) repeat protein
MKNIKNSLALPLALTLLLSFAPVFATCGGGGGGGMGGMDGNDKVYDVPWQKLKGDAIPPPETLKNPKSGLLVFWIPATDMELRMSTLKVSRPLAMYAAQCVNLYTVKDDTTVGHQLLGDGKASMVVMTGPDGTVLGKAESTYGPLKVEQVEELVTGEIKKRDDALKASMDDAAAKAQAGDNQGAIDGYRAVFDQKCLFPKRAREAARKLKKLGVTDLETMLPEGPNHDPALGARIVNTMSEGFKDEMADKYMPAEKLYLEAHRLDPGDPVPLRYLGELYRHDIGNWDKAAEVFNQILAMEADPLSRAVALHGLGKMTIHNGDFKKGLSLMEESTRVYPLALAYRNLAVYWNSEGDPKKAYDYTQEAFKLAPTDPFMLVFAAVFMAGSGHKEEALKVARENSGLMCGSYNLAAIYAQSGDKEKALELLRRHFFEYERYQSVRSKEMMEARVDHVFDSLKTDKTFLSLTSGADGKLKMR